MSALRLGLVLSLAALGAPAEDLARPEPIVGEAALVVTAAPAPLDGTATRARSFAELAELVADPHGPGVISLARGVYEGDLAIRRPVVLRGEPGAVLEGSRTGTVVTIDAESVTLEDLAIRGSGRRHTAEDAGVKATGKNIQLRGLELDDVLFGVAVDACRHCLVERVHVVGASSDAELGGDGIKLWEASDTVVRDCRVEHARDLVVWYSRNVTLEDNVVVGGRYGSHFMYAHDAVVRRSRFERNVVGVFVMYSTRLVVEDNILAGARGAAGIGLGFKDSDTVVARGNWIVANTVGSYLDNTPRTTDAPVRFAANRFALNDLALRFNTAERGITFEGNDFHENAGLVAVDGGSDALGVNFRENAYSDYAGYDLDGDGFGDVAHEVKALSSELTETHPALQFFHGTAALALVDAVARAMPLLATRKLVTDPRPRIASPLLSPPRTP